MSALDETDQGVASAVNNVTGQLAGLLAVVLLPAAAGLAGVRFSDPRFALGYGQALLVLTVLAVARIPLQPGHSLPTGRRHRPTDVLLLALCRSPGDLTAGDGQPNRGEQLRRALFERADPGSLSHVQCQHG